MQVQMLVQVRISASGGWMRPEAGELMEVNWQDLVEVPCRYYECSIQRAWSKVLLSTSSRSPPVFSPGELGTLFSEPSGVAAGVHSGGEARFSGCLW